MNAKERKRQEQNQEQQRRVQMENLQALAQRPDANSTDQQRFLSAQQQESNAPALEARAQKEAEEAAKDGVSGLEKLHGTVSQFANPAAYAQTQGAESSGIQGFAEDKADSGSAPKRNEGFINLYSRNFRRVAGEDPDEPDAREWWLATGQLSPYIDAKADEELQGGGEPGFWNAYSGLHNLVGKIVTGGFGVYGG